MTHFTNPVSSNHASPIDPLASGSSAEDLANEAIAQQVTLPQLIDKGYELYGDLTRGHNVGHLVAHTALKVEDARSQKAHLAIDKLEAHEKKLQTVTQFLTAIETQLANRDAKEVNMAGQHELVEQMRQILNHDLLAKTVWNRDEAESIKMAFTRHSQLITQDIHHSSSEVNRLIEESTELSQILRKCIEMWHQLTQTLTSNQRGR